MSNEKPIQRYEIYGDHAAEVPIKDGKYILFADHQKALSELQILCEELRKEITAQGGESWIEIQKTCSVQHGKLSDIRRTLWPDPAEPHVATTREGKEIEVRTSALADAEKVADFRSETIEVMTQAMNRMQANFLALRSELAEVAAERDRLARWKAEALTVESWWNEVDVEVRKHPETLLGRSIAASALRLIRERNEFKKLAEESLALAKQCQETYSRPK